jgi:hypothetical protein
LSSCGRRSSISERTVKSSFLSADLKIRSRYSGLRRKLARPAKRWLKRPGRLGFQMIRMIRWTFFLSADGDGHLAARVDPGVGHGDAVAERRGNQVLAVDQPSQQDLLVGDQLLLGQDVEELLDGQDLVLGLQVMDDLGGLEIVGKMGNLVGCFFIHECSVAFYLTAAGPSGQFSRSSP